MEHVLELDKLSLDFRDTLLQREYETVLYRFQICLREIFEKQLQYSTIFSVIISEVENLGNYLGLTR